MVTATSTRRIDVRQAQARISSAILATPLVRSSHLSALNGADVFLKLECRNETAAFKERGALAALLARGASARRGVVAASAGNHGKALALHGARLGIPVTVVMPRSTPEIKVRGVREYGANVVLVEGTFEDALMHASALARSGLELIPPFDDADVISGQGTIALEILAAAPLVEVIVAAVGGGGLLAGLSSAVSDVAPHVGIVGARTLRSTVAEGMNVAQLGELPARVLGRNGVPIVAVSESLLFEAMAMHHWQDGVMVEPAAAAPLAALLGYAQRFAGKRVALVLSGANVEPALFEEIVSREKRTA
ncbi:MAG: pyridoxal-phosphate dependent enzyme [Candidatus Eremiobacteraeota bacterium]|nr:pyridoxal-phosphate dependent enzyme [Candidatus Eremiobacteraeota bacterium]